MRYMKCTSALIVDDNVDIREAMEEALRTAGYRVYGVKNGKEAIAALKMIPGRPLVLLDMMMPVMDGWEFLSRFSTGEGNGANEGGKPTPVVVVSALGANAALADKTGALPAVGYIKKPFDLDSLLSLVGQYCDTAADVTVSAA